MLGMLTEQGSGGYGWKSVAQARRKRGHGSAEEEGEEERKKDLEKLPHRSSASFSPKYLKFTNSSQGFRYGL